ncbi:RlpA-like double-psi beta-barrel-protein domain-containing protein-containing protein [Desarmillaria ectypa]|nr:RlpA-like double-psi beta-barrel-protein domain-containing protein-containing protein [Desarmillaria ectypa]
MFLSLSGLVVLLFSILLETAAWINYAADGTATMTHYELPENYVASCGCTPSSTHYPTAALSQMAYGSSTAYGPGCGKCFNLTLLNSWTSTPPFYPSVTKHIVVKVTDLCPLSGNGWCSATESKPNPSVISMVQAFSYVPFYPSSGKYLNFDLAYPSDAIPDDFFPSNASLYGYIDFGVWNISYQTVSCENWVGWDNEAALGSVAYLGSESVCCPDNPTGSANDTCPSYSDDNGIPPDTTTNSSPQTAGAIPSTLILISILLSCYAG